MEDVPLLLKIPKSECPDFSEMSTKTQMAKNMGKNADPVAPLERNVYVHPWAGLSWERQFEEALLELGWGKKDQIGNVCSFVENRVISVRKCV